jgi:F420-dependent oxidoreductase-like protein
VSLLLAASTPEFGLSKLTSDFDRYSRGMRFGYWVNPSYSWTDIRDSSLEAEALGFDCIWMSDHFMQNAPTSVDGVTQECLSMLAALAAVTTKAKLGSIVIGNTYRHPAVLANMAATIDQISGGRFILGLGAGWQENEHTAYGFEFGTIRSRMDRLEETCEALNMLFAQNRTDYDGVHVQFKDAPLDPKPVQSPLPILIGGGGEKRTLKIVAKHAHQWNVWGDPATLAHKIDILNGHCAAINRDPATIEKTAVALVFLNEDQEANDKLRAAALPRPAVIGNAAEVVEQMRAYEAAGVNEFIIPGFIWRDAATASKALIALAAALEPVHG